MTGSSDKYNIKENITSKLKENMTGEDLCIGGMANGFSEFLKNKNL